MSTVRLPFPNPKDRNQLVELVIQAGHGAYSLPEQLPDVVSPLTGQFREAPPPEYWLVQARLIYSDQLLGKIGVAVMPRLIGLPEYDKDFGNLEPFVADFVSWEWIVTLMEALRDWPERREKCQRYQEIANQLNNLLGFLSLGIHNKLLAPIPIAIQQIADRQGGDL